MNAASRRVPEDGAKIRAGKRVRKALLDWFDRRKRSLPWRGQRDPYRIWLSEVMLQQTRVETVIEYYERFLERFPTLDELARTPIDEVLPYWSGLGYYRRVRNFHAAVCEVREHHGGRVPEDARTFGSLPGVGEYTNAAVRSIAFSQTAVLIDGNVERVLGRVLAIEEDVKSTAARQRMKKVLEAWIDPERPGDFNQALMELGATVCTPRKQDCETCPLRTHCEAHARGEQERFPVLRERKAPRDVRWLVVVATHRRAAFLVQRGPEERLAGLWGFPLLEDMTFEEMRRAVRRDPQALPRFPGVFGRVALADRLDLGPRKLLRHSILDLRIQAEIVGLPLAGARPDFAMDGEWIEEDAIAKRGICGLTKKILATGAFVSP